MSILIKGMEMPTDCHNCPLGFGGGCYCGTSADEYMCPDHGRADWCPLISVPPHGRLIDTSSSVQTQLYDDEHEEWTDVEMTVEDYLGYCNNDVPTVIPAEEGE